MSRALRGVWFCLALGIASLASLGSIWAQSPDDILIIANKSVHIDRLSLSDVQAYFLKLRQRWPDGNKVVPINAKANREARTAFVTRVMKMQPNKELAYWADQKIRLGQHPPVEFSNPLKAVFKLKGSIGYVFRSQYKEGVVKILAVIPFVEPKLPSKR